MNLGVKISKLFSVNNLSPILKQTGSVYVHLILIVSSFTSCEPFCISMTAQYILAMLHRSFTCTEVCTGWTYASNIFRPFPYNTNMSKRIYILREFHSPLFGRGLPADKIKNPIAFLIIIIMVCSGGVVRPSET